VCPISNLLLLIVVSTALAGPPSTEQLESVWDKHKTALTTLTEQPILLQPEDFEHISKGQVAKRRIRQDGPDRVMGAAWSPLSREEIWLAVLDDTHDTLVKILSERTLYYDQDGRKFLYQHLDLPWPISDRQWVIEVWNNTQLNDATHNQVWERVWNLSDSKKMDEPDPQAIWAPMTDGAWLFIPAMDGTLVIYHVRSTVGGAIPDEVVTRWALATVDEMIVHALTRAKEIPAHYGSEHFAIDGGDNQPVRPF
jgi:hypothetical protein